MGLFSTFEFLISIFLIVLAIMIGGPAWFRRTRNLTLMREGIQTWGYYQGNNRVNFVLEKGTRITFVSWKSVFRSMRPDEKLPVIYHPGNPDQAEVMTPLALLGMPALYLKLAGVLITLASALILEGLLHIWGMNSTLTLILFIVTWPAGYLLSIALYSFYQMVQLSLKPERRYTSARKTSQKPVTQPPITTASTPPTKKRVTRQAAEK